MAHGVLMSIDGDWVKEGIRVKNVVRIRFLVDEVYTDILYR
jgi:hypothetical protein